MKTAFLTIALGTILGSVAVADPIPGLVVTRCDVSLHSGSPGSYQSTHGEPLHLVPGPKVYQYHAAISVANHGAAPAQFVYVDVRGVTSAGATEWAPIGAYFRVVPAHGRAPAAGEPLPDNMSRAMRNGLDPDRPVRGFHCVVRDPGGTDSRARPIDD